MPLVVLVLGLIRVLPHESAARSVFGLRFALGLYWYGNYKL